MTIFSEGVSLRESALPKAISALLRTCSGRVRAFDPENLAKVLDDPLAGIAKCVALAGKCSARRDAQVRN